jgi:molybdate transport system regulatory protein
VRKKPSKLSPGFKLWLSTDRAEGVFGDGKWRLLQAIDQAGSLSAAAGKLHISYRKAWGDIQKAEEHLGVALIEKRRGGKAGGSATLTDEGRKWMDGYSAFRAAVDVAARDSFEKHIRQ